MKNEEVNIKHDEFHVALATVRYEGNLLWHIFSVFLIIHSVFATMLIQLILGKEAFDSYPGLLLSSVGGLALCIPWWATYSRNAAHYRYHLAHARELEPEGWNLYGGSGRDFSSGKRVKVGDEVHHLTPFAQKVKSGRMVPPVIMTFTVLYLIVIVYCAYQWLHREEAVSPPPHQGELFYEPGNYLH